MLVRVATGKMLIRLLLQKQSDLGLRCFSRPLWQATSVCNLTISTASLSLIHKMLVLIVV